LIDHTTSSPGLAVKIAEEAAKRGVHSVDGPVSGGDVGARDGCLVAMIGGVEEHVDAVRPILDCYSKEAKLMGGPGAG